MSREIDELFDNFRPSPFTGDPNRVAQEEGGGQPQPTGWYGGHQYSSSVGTKNMVRDATLENFNGVFFNSDGSKLVWSGGRWGCWLVVNSGTLPTAYTELSFARQDTDAGQAQSDVYRLIIGGTTGAYDATLYLVAENGAQSTDSTNQIPYLVASLMVIRNSMSLTDFTKRSVRVQIVDGTSPISNVLAESPDLDLTKIANIGDFAYLFTVLPRASWTANAIYRVRFDFAKNTTALSRSVNVGFAEPSLALNYDPEPGPFSPNLSQFAPRNLVNLAGGTIIRSRVLVSDTFDRFSVSSGGDMEWGSGTALDDVLLYRTAANELGFGSGDRLRVDGVVQQLGIGLLGDEKFLSAGFTYTAVGTTEVDLNSSFRVTYPGNSAMAGKNVLLDVYFDIAFTTAAASADINFSLFSFLSDFSAVKNPVAPHTSNRLGLSRQDVGANQWHQVSLRSTVAFAADEATGFGVKVRRNAGGAADVTLYGSATAPYVSRIGYRVIGYY